MSPEETLHCLLGAWFLPALCAVSPWLSTSVSSAPVPPQPSMLVRSALCVAPPLPRPSPLVCYMLHCRYAVGLLLPVTSRAGGAGSRTASNAAMLGSLSPPCPLHHFTRLFASSVRPAPECPAGLRDAGLLTGEEPVATGRGATGRPCGESGCPGGFGLCQRALRQTGFCQRGHSPQARLQEHGAGEGL